MTGIWLGPYRLTSDAGRLTLRGWSVECKALAARGCLIRLRSSDCHPLLRQTSEGLPRGRSECRGYVRPNPPSFALHLAFLEKTGLQPDTMTLYILENHLGEFLDKQLAWVCATDNGNLFHSPHRDVALNQLIELNARDIHLRAKVVACDVDAKGRPLPASAASAA